MNHWRPHHGFVIDNKAVFLFVVKIVVGCNVDPTWKLCVLTQNCKIYTHQEKINITVLLKPVTQLCWQTGSTVVPPEGQTRALQAPGPTHLHSQLSQDVKV